MRRKVLFALLILSSAGVASSSERVLTVTQNGCFGECPQYSISVSESGKVTYVGKDYVRVKGKETARVSKSVAADLFAKADRLNLHALQDDCDQCGLDGGSTTLTFKDHGKVKDIDFSGAVPNGVGDLVATVEAIGRPQRWVFVTKETFRELLDRGFNVMRDGPRYLAEAIDWDDPDVIKMLVREGVNVNGKTRDYHYLMQAVMDGRFKATQALLALGADPSRPEEKYIHETPAINSGYRGLDFLKLFVERKVDINQKDANGTTMLLAAAGAGQLDSVKYLIEHGADVHVRNRWGKGARELALEQLDREKTNDEVAKQELAQGRHRTLFADYSETAFQQRMTLFRETLALLETSPRTAE